MGSNKIVVHFARIKNVLIADIVNMPKELVGSGEIVSNERYEIASVSYALLTINVLYLTGSLDYNNDCYLSYNYDTEGEAQEALECFSELIIKYNKSILSTGDRASVEWERVEWERVE